MPVIGNCELLRDNGQRHTNIAQWRKENLQLRVDVRYVSRTPSETRTEISRFGQFASEQMLRRSRTREQPKATAASKTSKASVSFRACSLIA